MHQGKEEKIGKLNFHIELRARGRGGFEMDNPIILHSPLGHGAMHVYTWKVDLIGAFSHRTVNFQVTIQHTGQSLTQEAEQ